MLRILGGQRQQLARESVDRNSKLADQLISCLTCAASGTEALIVGSKVESRPLSALENVVKLPVAAK